jgi:hypothetical protein
MQGNSPGASRFIPPEQIIPPECTLWKCAQAKERLRGWVNFESAKSGKKTDVVSVGQVRCGRALLYITALILAVMPFTEHFWTFDRLGRGGQDFELGVLAFISLLGLILLLARHTRQGVSVVFSLKRWRSLIFEQMKFRLPILGRYDLSMSLCRASGSSSLDTLQIQLRI